jgi:hypothetical protein
MVDDDPNQQEQDENNYNEADSSGGRSSGGGGIGNMLMFLPMAFGLFRKFPKFTLFLLLIVGFMYFKGCSMFGPGGSSDMGENDGGPGRGADFDKKEFDKAEVFEPLDPSKTPLPERVSLEKFAPTRGDQGQQGSCVGWGSAYAARTILEAASTGQNPNQIVFSPSFLYNQISLRGCQGSYINRAMEVLTRRGALPLNEFPYDQNDCGRQPSQDQIERSGNYVMRGYNRLTPNGEPEGIDMIAIKQNLAAGAPVVIGMMVTNSFTNGMMGQKIWQPEQSDYQGENSLGGHCMCVIGYDDNLAGGAFQLMNSWSPRWGDNGLGWVRYKDFMHFTQEAYGVYPLPKRGDMANRKFACEIGLADVQNKRYLPLSVSSGNLFKTTQPIAKGTKFKIELKNSTECYTYIFGEESDKTSYVLFPYTKKHSPFCGITGYRMFPRYQSLQADQVGNKDFMAIIVTKQAIDFNKMNAAINASRQPTYQGKVNEAIGNMGIQNVRFASSNGIIKFESQTAENQAVAMVIEIDKQ